MIQLVRVDLVRSEQALDLTASLVHRLSPVGAVTDGCAVIHFRSSLGVVVDLYTVLTLPYLLELGPRCGAPQAPGGKLCALR